MVPVGQDGGAVQELVMGLKIWPATGHEGGSTHIFCAKSQIFGAVHGGGKHCPVGLATNGAVHVTLAVVVGGVMHLLSIGLHFCGSVHVVLVPEATQLLVLESKNCPVGHVVTTVAVDEMHPKLLATWPAGQVSVVPDVFGAHIPLEFIVVPVGQVMVVGVADAVSVVPAGAVNVWQVFVAKSKNFPSGHRQIPSSPFIWSARQVMFETVGVTQFPDGSTIVPAGHIEPLTAAPELSTHLPVESMTAVDGQAIPCAAVPVVVMHCPFWPTIAPAGQTIAVIAAPAELTHLPVVSI